jgi:hypothetical protein
VVYFSYTRTGEWMHDAAEIGAEQAFERAAPPITLSLRLGPLWAASDPTGDGRKGVEVRSIGRKQN